MNIRTISFYSREKKYKSWHGTYSYSLPPTEHRLNSMTFFVRVPVLSVNTYLTIPSSSFRLLVRAIAGVSVSGWYISMSILINVA